MLEKSLESNWRNSFFFSENNITAMLLTLNPFAGFGLIPGLIFLRCLKTVVYIELFSVSSTIY